MQMCGGVGADQDVNDEVKGYCEEVKAAMEEKAGKSFEMFSALKFKSQVVAGVNYFVKIQVHSSGECVHARIFKPLPHTGEGAQLTDVQTAKQAEDALEYF